eukprot:TRINITY_DN2241_c0_g1_i2.p1 TRINITY_DN2241_c0_g1~~TRINITY_DN2241_c0_g1_i2.p1  ORF type:complete len:293 (-),score=84.64 TRINITY_DN2241_c0_g1_i2:9-887(-)
MGRSAKYRKVKAVDPFFMGDMSIKKPGKPIKQKTEAEYIPKQLRAIMKWKETNAQYIKQMENLGKKSKKENGKNLAKLKRDAFYVNPAELEKAQDISATLYLGDDISDIGESENEDEEEENSAAARILAAEREFEEEKKQKEAPLYAQKYDKDGNPIHRNITADPYYSVHESTRIERMKQKQKETKRKDAKKAALKAEEDDEKDTRSARTKEIEKKHAKSLKDFSQLNDKVSFGEVVERPPRAMTKPKIAVKFDDQKEAKQINQKRMRDKANISYQAAKRRKTMNTGNKFFL